jgi:hypothetical protein
MPSAPCFFCGQMPENRDNEVMSKKKRNKKPKTTSELLDAIKKKYFDGKPPTNEKQRHAVNFLFETYSFNLNSKK